ncbi:MAG TPA: hypothetical protein VHU44_04535 [Acidobacteriaceae bacterium]|nr:hypothetical protein [Acidobacteriaceae bacterium]
MLRKTYWALTFVASLIVPASIVLAQMVAAFGDRPTDGPTVAEQFSGVVLNSVTNQPVPGVLVTAPGRPLAVLTDFQGRFQFQLTRVVQPSSGAISQQSLPLAFQLRKPGYLARICLASVPYYASNPTTSNVELRIIPAAVISGHIQAEIGTLPTTTSAILYRRQVNDGTASWIQTQNSQLNSRGEFRFANLPPGNYKVGAFAFDANLPQADVSSVEGLLPTFYPNAESVDTAAAIHLNAGDSPSANLTLRSAILYRAVLPVVVPDQPNSVSSGPRAGSPVVVDQLIRGYDGVQVAILPETPGLNFNFDRGRNAAIGYLPSGSYDVRLSTNGPAAASTSVRLNISGAPVRTAPVTLHPAAEVPIYVSWNFTSGKVQDAQPRNEYATLVSLRPGSTALLDQPGTLRRNPGAVHVVTVTEGLYRFQMNVNNGYVASAVSGTTDLLREPLHVGPGESPQPIQVTLRDDAAALRITVLDPSHVSATAPASLLPQQVAMILCVPLDEPMRQPILQFTIQATAATIGSNFTNVPPGHYLVLASQQDEMTTFTPEYRNSDVLAPLMSKGVAVTLTAGEKASVQVSMLPGDAE